MDPGPAHATAIARRGARIPATHVPGELIASVITDHPFISFTFDDGPWPSHTQGVMNHFRAAGLEGLATFFWIGANVRALPHLAREVVDRGYLVGNHTITHRYTPSVIAAAIAPMQDLVHTVVGVRPVFFRSPGLTKGDIIQRTLAVHGMCNVFTETDLGDWRSPRRSAWQLVSAFERTVRPGSIVLLHDGGTHQPTVDAIPGMLEVARRKGLEVVPLDVLLRSGRRYPTPVGPSSVPQTRTPSAQVDDGDPDRADAVGADFDATLDALAALDVAAGP